LFGQADAICGARQAPQELRKLNCLTPWPQSLPAPLLAGRLLRAETTNRSTGVIRQSYPQTPTGPMAAIFAFTCTCCGKMHEGSPSFSFEAPWQYASLSQAQQKSMTTLSNDFCTITHEEGTDHFIRAVLEIPIQGVTEPFTWGIWVSLSEKSFRRYAETFNDPVAGEGFFGWVCNKLPGYPPGDCLATDVVIQAGGLRPKLYLHHDGSGNVEQLVLDQLNGISIARAQELAERAQHGV
jgi:hypothetical protein